MLWWAYWWPVVWSQAVMAVYAEAGSGIYGSGVPRRRIGPETEDYLVRELREDLDALGVEGLVRGE